MTGPEFAFGVRPRSLTVYAETLPARAADLAAVGEAVAAARVERHWFGKLPQSGFLAERYVRHLEGVLTEVGELSAWLVAAQLGLAESAERYSAADRVVAEAAEDAASAEAAGTAEDARPVGDPRDGTAG